MNLLAFFLLLASFVLYRVFLYLFLFFELLVLPTIKVQKLVLTVPFS